MAAYIGNLPIPQASQNRDTFVATEGQTTFATSGYSQGYVDVYLNGVHLNYTDFTATNGSDVVLAVAASADDTVDVIAYKAVNLTNAAKNGLFWENDQTVGESVTLTADKNAGTFGPITISDGVTVTIPSGSTWTIV